MSHERTQAIQLKPFDGRLGEHPEKRFPSQSIQIRGPTNLPEGSLNPEGQLKFLGIPLSDLAPSPELITDLRNILQSHKAILEDPSLATSRPLTPRETALSGMLQMAFRLHSEDKPFFQAAFLGWDRICPGLSTTWLIQPKKFQLECYNRSMLREVSRDCGLWFQKQSADPSSHAPVKSLIVSACTKPKTPTSLKSTLPPKASGPVKTGVASPKHRYLLRDSALSESSALIRASRVLRYRVPISYTSHLALDCMLTYGTAQSR